MAVALESSTYYVKNSEEDVVSGASHYLGHAARLSSLLYSDVDTIAAHTNLTFRANEGGV